VNLAESGSAMFYTAPAPYTGGTLYFALKTQNTEGDWSAQPNNWS